MFWNNTKKEKSMKTKLGVNVGIFGALIYFAALFGGYVPLLLLVGYVLVMEQNEWLKNTAIKAVATLTLIYFWIHVADFIPDVLSWLGTISAVFQGTFDYSKISQIISVITGALGIYKTCIFLLLGINALKQKTIKVPVVDKMIEKFCE